MFDKELKRYQEGALDELILKSKLLLDKNIEKRTIVFQSPTGSGKTFIMSQYIKQLVEDFEDEDFCFLWVSIGKGALHTQSYDSLKSEFQGSPAVHLLEQEFFGSRYTISKDEVVVVNWEKIRSKDNKTGEWKNILMKDKETTNFRELIQNTKEEDLKIVMVIDESHSSSTSERALELRDDIVNADLTIEMSATPVLREGQYHEKVVVQPNDVIEEGMIKKEIVINENIDAIGDDETTSQELVMEAAYMKRLHLKEQYNDASLSINPLVLIQLPTSDAGDDKKAFVESFLASKGITYDNGKLAVWLTEEKINQEKGFITKNNSEVEYLIFKQAIDTGWDCPRAQALVRFREIKSIVFEIQTVGRILRMPEAKHYNNDNLNKGYLYTNVKSLEVKKETYNPNIIKSIVVKRKELYKPLKLKSYYRNRFDYGDISASFYGALEDVFCNYFNLSKDKFDTGAYSDNRNKLKEKIDLSDLDNQDEIILNKRLDTRLFDYLNEEKIIGDTLDVRLSQDDLYHAFEALIKMNLGGFAPKRSIPTVKQALYRWFRKYLNINLYGTGIIYIQNIVLNNFDVFSEIFDRAINAYKPIKEQEVKAKITETEEWNDEWEIEICRNYNPHTYTASSYKLSLYEPCYLKFDSHIEKQFIEYLEGHADKVEWWWQNGSEHMAINFGIKYNTKSTFQPDFLVMLKDGRLGIFDTKASGYNEDDNKLKGEALQQYISEENSNGKNMFGGLIIKEGQHFRINSKTTYTTFKNDPTSWDYFDFSLS